MTFRSYYESLSEPQKEFCREKILQETGVSQSTFYYWLQGKIKNIALLNRKAISEITGIDIEELFPTEIVELPRP